MRILWFSNTPSLADNVINNRIVVGGWVKSLEVEIRKHPGVELAIAFNHTKHIQPFTTNGTKYYPIYKPYFLIPELIKRYLRFKINLKSEVTGYLRIIDDYKPDLIHIHGTEYPFGSFMINNCIDIPVVISIQGILTVISKKFFAGLDKSIVKKLTPIRDLLLRNSFIDTYESIQEKAKLERQILQNCKFIIGRTNWDKRISSVLATSSKYFHVDEILRNEFYEATWRTNDQKTKIILTVLSPAIYKGIETIFETALLLKEYSHISFQWRIIGLKKADSIVKLTMRCLGIKNDVPEVSFIGSLDEGCLVSEFLSADIYVSASHIENSPNNVCEAMLLGLPIISTNVGGVSSLLTDNKEGILVQDGDPWSLAGAIKYYLENYETAIEYGKSARIRAIKRHDKGKIADVLFTIYNDLVKGSSTP